MGGAILVVVGFSVAADSGFQTPHSYSIIIPAIVLLAGSFVNFACTGRTPIIPPVSQAFIFFEWRWADKEPQRIFKIRTTALFLLSTFLSSTCFFPTNFLLPQLFQGVRQATNSLSKSFTDSLSTVDGVKPRHCRCTMHSLRDVRHSYQCYRSVINPLPRFPAKLMIRLQAAF